MRYTLILIPETAQGSVRKLQVRRAWLRAAVGTAIALVAISGVLLHDYVRLRRDLRELPQLRSERDLQGEELRRYGAQFSQIEGELERVREFERKLRVISDLPGTAVDPAPKAPGTGTGQGGGADESALAAPGPQALAGAAASAARSAGSTTLAALGNPTAPFSALSRWLAAEPPAAAPASPDTLQALERWAQLHSAAQALERRLDARNASLAELESQLAHKADRLAATPSIWPTRGWITSRFGRRVSPFTGLMQEHSALDIAAEPGTPVVAPARGQVVSVSDGGPLGKTLTLDHGFGVHTMYGHAQQIFVKPGQKVERGQRIAAVGNSGRSTGPHLHYALEINGRAVDPIDYILD